MTQRSKLIQLSCVAVLALAAASCGSDSKSSSSTAAATSTPTTAAATTAPTTAATTATTTATTEATASSAATESTAATGETMSSDATGSSEAGETTTGAGVKLVDSDLGKILADSDGKTLYLFTKDSGTTSSCAGDCATAWPAFHGPAKPGTGLDEEDFATITGTDGKPQATFYGHPLYYFSGDAAPGDVNGQGVGGVWFAVDSEGNAAGASTTTTTG